MKKFRPETTLERIQRMHHIYDNGPKPKHFDDPKVIDQENLGKKPKPFNNNDSSSYPSNRDQKQRLSSWDIIFDTTMKSGTKEEKNEMREYLKEKAKDPTTRKYLTAKEKRFISAAKVTPAPLPPVNFTIPEPLVIEQDPQLALMEQRFNETLRKSQEEKIKMRNSGLASLVGGSKAYVD